MYEEEKVINFTTQNSFLHYGRKGMKWGKNIFEEDEVSSTKKNQNTFTYDSKTRTTVPTNGTKAYKVNNSRTTTYKNGNTTIKNTVKPIDSEYQREQQYNNGASTYTHKVGNATVTNRISPKPIDSEYQREMAANSKNNSTVNTTFLNDKSSPQTDEKRQHMYESSKNTIEKFQKAFDSISDMDEKHSKKLFDRYANKIATACGEFFESSGAQHVMEQMGMSERQIKKLRTPTNFKEYKNFLDNVYKPLSKKTFSPN